MKLLGRLLLVVVAMIVADVSLGLNHAWADELPKDTNTIESLTPEQARKLAKEFPGVSCVMVLKGEGSGTVSMHDCLPLNGLKSVDAELAKALAGRANGPLLLDGLMTLSEEAAASLAQQEGLLFLTGLTTLPPAAAKALAQHTGTLELNLGNLQAFLTANPLTPDSAAAWAALLKGDLSFVTALESPDSVAVAQALATRKGPLKLPSLKRISPKALTALIENKDVEIPLIETLELIPEPDGSPTDDFVTPKWLEDRQSQKPSLPPLP